MFGKDFWQLVVGCWLLAVGCWLAFGNAPLTLRVIQKFDGRRTEESDLADSGKLIAESGVIKEL